MLPPISIIVPVRDDPGNLNLCLQALQASDYPEAEILVIDDGSNDHTPEVAQLHRVWLIRQGTSIGLAEARNLGARYATHEYLFFIDADVYVHPHALRRGMQAFLDDPSTDAVSGSYDLWSGARNAISQYRNLLHYYLNQDCLRETCSFWSGCGAIKRSVFIEMGGFSATYDEPSIGGIELGARLRQAGHRLVPVKLG